MNPNWARAGEKLIKALEGSSHWRCIKEKESWKESALLIKNILVASTKEDKK